MNDFEIVKNGVNILDYITKKTGMTPKKTGKSFLLSACPLDGCGSKKGFHIWPEIGGWKCYACDKKGDIFKFDLHYSGIEKYQSLKDHAEAIGHALSANGKFNSDSAAEKTHQAIFNAAANFYCQQLLKDKKALKILANTRTYTDKTVEEFKIGYTGNAYNALYAHLSPDYDDETLLKSGLFKMRGDKISDYFIPQLFIFPHIKNGEVSDFTIKDALKHKKKKEDVINYRLAGDSRLNNVLFYGQDHFYNDEIILVEGEHDALQVMRAGQKRNAIAVCGNLSEHQQKFLAKALKGKTVYTAFDNDKEGKAYLEKVFHLAWPAAKIRVLDFEGSQKDIDEHLRRSSDPEKCLARLKDESIEVFKWIISKHVRIEEDLTRQMEKLAPFTGKLAELDTVPRETCLEALRERFDNSAVTRIIEKEIKEKEYSKNSSGANQANLPCYEKDGIYFRRHHRGAYGITNFTLKVEDVVLLNDEIFYRCSLTNDKGEHVEECILSPADRSHARKFREKVTGKGSFYFTGSDADLAAILQYEESRSELRKSFYVQHYGYVRKDDLWLWGNAAIKDGKIYEEKDDFITIGNRNYKSYDVVVYSGAVPRLDVSTPYSQDFTQKVSDAFHTVLDRTPGGSVKGYKGLMFLGFVPAVLYAEEIFHRNGFFPFLFSYGPSGTGKTTVTQLLLSFFGFNCSPESWDDVSVAGLRQFLMHIGAMPCWVDEFLNDHKFKELLGTIKNLYNRSGGGKGGLDKRNSKAVNGCFWLSGEDNPQNEALLSRSIIFRFDPINDKKTAAFRYLTEKRGQLSSVVRQLLLDKTPQKAAALLERIDYYAKYILENAEKIDNRVAVNHAIPAAAIEMLGVTIPEGYLDYVCRHAQAGYNQKTTESPIFQFFTELAFIYNRGPALNKSVRWDPVTGELAVHFESAIRIIQKEMRFRNEALKIKASSIKDYLRDLPALIESKKRVWVDGAQRRCMVFQYDQLPQNLRDVVEFNEYQVEEV